jgi:HSP20 family protein
MTLLAKRKRSNGEMIPSLRNDLSEMFDFDNLFDNPLFENSLLTRRKLSRVPATNIMESDEEYVVQLAAPGLNKKDFHINLDNETLEIKVENEEEKEDEDLDFTRREYDYRMFYRSFNLPETVNPEKINAEYENGILKVHLPKVANAKRKPPKAITVK